LLQQWPWRRYLRTDLTWSRPSCWGVSVQRMHQQGCVVGLQSLQ
jgi:hypothetical protein